jgi:CDGSH-type Zn-finger protein
VWGTQQRTARHEEASMTVKITCRPNGPYLLEGDVEILDTAGHKVDTTGRPRIALCRCGASVTKPFCDGTHSKIGFQAAEGAVASPKP